MPSSVRIGMLMAALALGPACAVPRVNLRPVLGEMHLPETGHTFIVPSGWMQSLVSCPGVSLERAEQPRRQIYVDREAVAFTTSDPAGEPVDAFLEVMDGQLGEWALERGGWHLKRIKVEPITVDGVPARRYVLAGGKQRAIVVFTYVPGSLVMLRYLGYEKTLARDLPDFDAVVASFRFGDAAPGTSPAPGRGPEACSDAQ